MNYDNPQLLDRLAGEYVLGTLQGAARRRFERMLQELPEAQAAVDRWQPHFEQLANALPPVQPSEAVWTGIEKRIDGSRSTSTPQLGFWRGWALLTSFALVLAIGFWQFETPVQPQQPQVAFVNEANATPLWVVSMDFDSGQLSTHAISAEAQELDKVFELWMLPATGSPRSLGLMPVNGGRTTREFSPALLELLRSANGLAVSIEPAGGSPTGLPTGPVVYQANLFEL